MSNITMKRTILTISTVGMIIGALPALGQPAGVPVMGTNGTGTDFSKIFKDDKEKFSYAIGMFYAGTIKNFYNQHSNDVDLAIIQKTLADDLNGGTMRITEQQQQTIINGYSIQLRFQQAMKQKAQEQQGVEFLAKNKTAPGVVALEDGLQYKVQTAGTGPKPGPNDIVTVNYRGRLVDGTEFDSSERHGGPADLALNNPQNKLIPGWVEALQMMPVGSKWTIYIPSSLGYGEKGSQPVIGPNAMLTFDLELVATKPAPAPVAPPAPESMTSDIIRVPSQEGLKHGDKIELIKASDAEKAASQTNH